MKQLTTQSAGEPEGEKPQPFFVDELIGKLKSYDFTDNPDVASSVETTIKGLEAHQAQNAGEHERSDATAEQIQQWADEYKQKNPNSITDKQIQRARQIFLTRFALLPY